MRSSRAQKLSASGGELAGLRPLDPLDPAEGYAPRPPDRLALRALAISPQDSLSSRMLGC